MAHVQLDVPISDNIECVTYFATTSGRGHKKKKKRNRKHPSVKKYGVNMEGSIYYFIEPIKVKADKEIVVISS